MRVRLLGPLEVERSDGTPVVVAGHKERALLAVLAVNAGTAVTEGHLVDVLWGDDPPRTAARTLQGYVSRIRRVLADGADGDPQPLDIRSHGNGWTLRGAAGTDVADATDIAAVDRLVRAGRERAGGGDAVGAALALADALGLWRGRPLLEFLDQPWAALEAARLDELHQLIVEERVDAELACGRHAELVGELELLCRSHPLRERVWRQRMLALYRSGRQAEALRAYQDLRATLVDELGIEPSPATARLEQAVLHHAPELDTPSVVDAAAPLPGAPAVATLVVFDAAARGDVVHDLVAATGGDLDDSLGDAIAAAFVDAAGAVTCAVAVQRRLARLGAADGHAGGARVGIHTGDHGASSGHEPSASLIVAKRLSDAAAPGQIVASRVTCELAGARVAPVQADLGLLDVKGAGRPVPACSIDWRLAVEHPPPATLASFRGAAFVGRERELAVLADAWQRAEIGQPQVVLLAGEPGIGKTTLAVHLADRAAADGATVLFGRCDEESIIAFQPWVESLGHLVDATDPEVLRRRLGPVAPDLALMLPGLERRLPELATIARTSADKERYRIFDAVATTLEQVATTSPLLLVLDDLHWADRPTLQLLQHVIRRCNGCPLLIVGTYRDTDLVRTHPMAEVLADLRRAELVARIPVRGLERAAVVELIAGSAVPDAADEALADALWRETEGNPLFLRESLRHLAETDAVTCEDGHWRARRRIEQLGIPEGVREVIGRRLTRLGDAANTALRVGSVQGREIRLDVLEHVTDLTTEQLLDGLEDATSAGVVDEVPGAPGRWSFTHALVRQALYEELSVTRRIRLHQRIGAALEEIHGTEDGAHLASLAFHFTQAAVAGEAARAIDYGRRAGAHAVALTAYEEAARHLAVAFEVAEDAGEPIAVLADLLFAQGDAEWRTGDARIARATFERAAALVRGTDPDRFGRAAVSYATGNNRFLWVDGFTTHDRSIELLEEALAGLPEEDGATRALALGSLAVALYFVRMEAARRDALSAEAVAIARRIGDPSLLGRVLSNRNLSVWEPRCTEEIAANAAEVLAIGEANGDAHLVMCGLAHGALAQQELGAIAVGRALVDRLEVMVEERRDLNAHAMFHGFRAFSLLSDGDLVEAERRVVLAYQTGQEVHDPNALLLLAFGTGILRTLQGRTSELLPALREFETSFPHISSTFRILRAMCAAESGLVDDARALLAQLRLDDPTETSYDLTLLLLLGFAARACFLVEDAATARVVYDMLAPYADRSFGFGGVASMQLGLAVAAAAMGDRAGAEHHFDLAHARHAALGWPTAAVDTEWFHALMLDRLGDGGDAARIDELLARVATGGDAVGMAGRAQQARALLAQRAGDHGDGDGSPPARTRRERAFASLATRGRAAAAGWTRERTDDELVRRFSSPLAQRALFKAAAAAFQPSAAYGFEGDIVYELRSPDDNGDPAASDWWTLEVRGRKATARTGTSDAAALVLRADLADHLRIASGELGAAKALVDGTLDIDGDIMLAVRLADMFGIAPPLDPVAP